MVASALPGGLTQSDGPGQFAPSFSARSTIRDLYGSSGRFELQTQLLPDGSKEGRSVSLICSGGGARRTGSARFDRLGELSQRQSAYRHQDAAMVGVVLRCAGRPGTSGEVRSGDNLTPDNFA